MSEQGNAVSPGQAIYDSLSDEAKAAVDALPDDLFAGESGIAAAHRFVDAIEIVHAEDPFSWSLQLRNTSPTNLGLQVFWSWRVVRLPGTLLFGTERDSEMLPRVRERSGEATPALEEFLEKQTPIAVPDGVDLGENLLSDLVMATEQGLREAARLGWRRAHSANSHRDDWRAKLALLTGRDVPAPGYVNTRHFGISQATIDAPPWLRNRLTIDATLLLAEAISAASSEHPGSWALTGGKSRTSAVRFDVDGTTVLEFQNRCMRLVVPREWWDLHMDDVHGHYLQDVKSLTEMVRINIDPVPEAVDFQQYAEPITDVVRRLASMTRTPPQRVQEHRPELVKELTEFLNEQIPQPSYVSDLPLLTSYANLSDEAKSVERLPHLFRGVGLVYTEAQIASFYTALQTKGFVILSGISGTGKSKIAQHFAGFVRIDAARAANSVQPEAVVHRLELREYMRVHNRFTVPTRVGENFALPPQGESFDIVVRIEGIEEGARARVWNQTPNGFQVFLRKRAAEQFRKIEGSEFFLEIVENEHTGAPETLIVTSSRQVDRVIRGRSRSEMAVENHLFLPVRPDWRDGKPLIGYHNPLSGEYVRTPFLDFVLAAADDYRAGNRNAFFVILDEMNLAHVEYYFADVLSVIESGRDADGWTVEGIPLAVGEEDADLPETLRLPPNLYIVGTVNMDETTYPFSPKVLDRAFTIELTEVSFEKYPPEPVDAADLTEEDRQALLAAFTLQGRYPRIDKDEIRAVVETHPRYRADLQGLNTSLRRRRMHFGYRVFDEVMQFVRLAEENGLFADPDAAFDRAVLMKVLPKFNGSRGKLHHALFELLHWCRTPMAIDSAARAAYESQFTQLLEDGKSFADVVIAETDTVEDSWRYPATGRRAALMMQDLYTDGFASFG